MRRDTETSIATSVRASLGERSGIGGPAPTDLIERIVESVDPALIRSLWRGLTRIIVLDPRCDSPVWLLSAAEFLEACYIAILSRMKSSLIDAATTRGPGAYERHLAHPLPFESSDERVEKQLVRPSISVSKVPIAFAGMKLEGLDRTIIRRTIVRRHLVGLASSKSSMTRCRHALLAFTGENRRHFPSLDTNVRQLSIQDPVNGFRSIGSAEVWAEQTGSSEVGKETSNIGAAEEIDAFAHAWSLIIDARDSHEWTVDEWRKTARDLRRLRARLVSRTSNRRATHSQAGDPHFRAVDIDPRLVIPAWETDRHVIVRAA